MTAATQPEGVARPRRLLTQNNSNLRRDNIWTWSIPALAARLPDGRTVRTCPSAGVCARACYARNGTYNIPSVRARHVANLSLILDDLPGWEQQMIAEVAHPRMNDAWVRIHDAGDFLSASYLSAWLRVIASAPQTQFYCYTKEVELFRALVEPDPPTNFRWVYSLGGVHDQQLDPNLDRVADVFPTQEAIDAVGWHSNQASDLLAVTGPSPVGMAANKIQQARRLQGDRTFGQWQADERRRAGR